MTKDSPRTSVLRDAELIARLRDAKRDWPEFGHDRAEAADRIEALTAKLAECEARLGKAVEALAESVREFDCPIARATLAEIKSSEFATQKGESHE